MSDEGFAERAMTFVSNPPTWAAYALGLFHGACFVVGFVLALG